MGDFIYHISTNNRQRGVETSWEFVCFVCSREFVCLFLCLFRFTTFIHLVVCLTTGPKPLPKPALHIVRSIASFFNWQYPLLSLRSSSSFLRLLPRLPAFYLSFNPLNTKLNPICHLLALLGAHHIFHVSSVRVNTKHWIFRLALTAFCLMIILL